MPNRRDDEARKRAEKEKRQAEILGRSSRQAGESIRAFREGRDIGGPDVPLETVHKAAKQGRKLPPTEPGGASIRTPRSRTYRTAAPAAPQRVIVEQKPAWSGPPIKPIKIAGQPLPGAANAVFILGFGLAAVALWNTTVVALWDLAWNGPNATRRIILPPGPLIGLVGFVLLLVFVASLSPESAQVTLYLMLALWAVFLVMNPGVLQTVFGWMQQPSPRQNEPLPPSPPAPAHTRAQGATH